MMVKHYLQAFLAMLIICCAPRGYAQVVQKLTSSGTWTAPPGVTSVTVEAWGAGGGGGGTALNPSQGGGGAGGSYSKKVIPVVPGTTYNINVGTGGLAGSATGGNGGNGGDSWFGSATNVTGTSATISFTTSQSNPTGGYDYFVSSTNTPPAANATPTGNVSGSPFTLPGDYIDAPKYIFVRARCSDTSQSLWAGPAYADAFCRIGNVTNIYTAKCIINGFASPASDTIVVAATPVTQPVVTGADTICPGATAMLTASNCNGTLSWSNAATTTSITVPAGSYTASCTLDGCVLTSDTAIIAETNLTTPVVTGPSSVCPGATATLTAGNCAGTITWSNGATGTSIDVPAGSYTATCTIDGCVSPASAPVAVTETPVTTPVITGNLEICPGGGTTLTANNCSGTILWADANGNPIGQYAELNGNVPGDIYQDITVPPTAQSLNWSLDHKGRADAEPANEQTITVVVSAADGSNPQTVVHTASITNWEQVAGVYQTLPGQTSVRIRVISSAGNNIPGRGNFIDNVKANYVGCTAVARAAEEEGAPAAMRATVSLSVQPNPVIAQAALVLTGFDDGIVSIDIVSANGTLSKSMKMPYSTGAKLILDLADFRDGMYFIKVQQDGKIASSKFTKQQ